MLRKALGNARPTSYFKLFSSCSRIVSSSPLDLENQLRSLCEKPNSQFSAAVLLFHHAIESQMSVSPSTCNFLGHTLARSGKCDLVFSVYEKNDRFSYLSQFCIVELLIACFVDAHEPKFALGVLGLVLKCGYKANALVRNLVLKGFCQSSEVQKARELFDVINSYYSLSPDVFGYTTLMNGLCKVKKLNGAVELLVEMEISGCDPNFVTHSTLMDGFVKNGRVNKAFELLKGMTDFGLEPNVIV